MKFFKRFLNKWTIGIAVVLLIIIVIIIRRNGNGKTIESTQAKIGNVVEEVSVTGRVAPVEEANLAFKKSGVITSIAVKVGEYVHAGELIASLDSAADQAAVSAAQATLADMSRSLTPQELAVQEADLETARKSALNAAADAYNKVENAIINYTNSFFSNPQSVNPVLQLSTPTVAQERSIETQQRHIIIMLPQWNADIDEASSSAASTILQTSQHYVTTVIAFLNDLAAVVNVWAQNNSFSSSNTTYLALINTANTAVTSALNELTSAQTSLATAESNFNLKLSGNSSQSIAAQQARVEQAEADLSQDQLISPIDGLITRADPNVGEFTAAGSTGFAVQSAGLYKIEAYVPEADIAKVAVGNFASTTLDAYGSDIDFPSTVTMIDPAETILEGVPTYKVTLQFIHKDDRIRSGMTANLDILTHEHDNVLEVPTRAVADDSGQKSVRLLNADGKTFKTVPVTVGLKGSDGMIEITSGLSEGDAVVTYTK